jgi:L-proline amide hydrolase
LPGHGTIGLRGLIILIGHCAIPYIEWMDELTVTEGKLAFGDYETWYRVTGDLASGVTPLVVLHGGPGCSHDYLVSIAEIARSGRPILHYDQLGGGRSTLLPEKGPDFWTVELFLDELDNLLTSLGVDERYHLLGQSWGGMLGAEHAIRRPKGLNGLVLSNSPASMALWASEAKILRSLLDPETESALDRHEAAGTILDPEYLAATKIYYDEHVCRVLPNPPEVLRTFDFMSRDSTVYNTMNGPNEFFCVGTLRDWSVVDRVHQIEATTLLLSGRHDEATPATVQPFFDNIPNVRWEIFENSSHMPFVEEPDAYRETVEDFLDGLDS